jgi:hypothetical protein
MSNLDQIVKGAPPPGSHFAVQPTTPIIEPPADSPASAVSDPLATLPSSPPQIYLNLLILEASLRAQWLQLRTRRRQYSFFLTLLALWICFFCYALFFAPREDGSGVGGSVYWVVEVTEKVCLMGGIVTGILVWGTGQWERGIRWPRRWVGTTNRGLRGFNCKLVVIKQTWWREMLSALSFLFSYGLFSRNSGTSYRYVGHSMLVESEKAVRAGGQHLALPNIHEDDVPEGYEEDLSPGGDCIKLLLLPKPFSPNFRENWDIFRTEYWEKENERRAILRAKMHQLDMKIAKQQGGWLWWTGYRGWRRRNVGDIEKTHNASRQGTLHKDHKRGQGGIARSGSHSRNSSRSTTPSVEPEDGSAVGHVRRGSTASDHRKKKSLSGPRASKKLSPTGSRPSTPDVHSPLARRDSASSMESERPSTPGDGTARALRASVKPGGSPGRRPPSVRMAK